jgi:polysaccharide biosynthesis/export protein
MNILTKSAVLLAGVLSVAALAGCGGDMGRLQAFLQQPRSPVAATEYRVLPPDRITIASQHVVDINGVSQILSPDGKVNLPLIGEIYIADRTPHEIEEILKLAAKKYYEEVDATVTVTGYASRKIYVFGQVGRPGPIAYTGADTLVDVLAQVQPTTLAWPERIKVVRGGSPQRGGYLKEDKAQALEIKDLAEKNKDKLVPEGSATAPTGSAAVALKGSPAEFASWTATGTAAAKDNGEATLARVRVPGGIAALTPQQREEFTESEVLTIDLMAMMKKGDLSQNILLKPDDIIYVPPNPLAEIGLTIQMILFPIQPAIQAVGVPASGAAATMRP